ncbi:hypothetical protein [Kordia sp.]|uniref:hypothetical protein n=1 Tax=Kordia sp. TaxID=1965332 RepID=UPI003D6A97C1
MLSFEPRIAVIDDKIDEVEGIIQKYQKEGVGIKYFNAHLANGDDKPNIHFSDLNLIYLDVHYTENIRDYDPELCAAWIYSLVPEYSFYILILWSKETDSKDEILEELKKINRSPFACIVKQKNDFKTKDSWDFEKLELSIKGELEKYPEIDELATWKKSIIHSSNTIIGHLVKGIDADALKKKLQKIIIGHGGTYLLGQGNENEKRKVLFDALDNILSSNSKSTRPLEEITQVNNENLYNIPEFPKTDIDSKLNSWFHFILQNPIPKELIIPGLISICENESLIKNYNIQRDDNIAEYLSFQTNHDDGERSPELIDIAMIISRPCDVAQNKYGRNLKLLGGLLILNPIRKKNKLKGKSTMPLSLKIFDHLYLDEERSDCALIFDFRYAFSLPPNIFHERFNKIKIFNKELLSEIQVEYSSYSNRLGITQII